MQSARRTGTIVAAVAALLVPLAVHAQSTTSGRDSASAARAEALANLDANRGAVISETVERWRSAFGTPSPSLNIDREAEFAALLEKASSEKLLAASQAQTYSEAVSLLRPNRQPDVIRLEPGSPMPHILGDAGDDIVFTPVTPCRIIDTRLAVVNTRIGPDLGRQFSVSLADFTPQGGAASNCGIPFAPAAVAVNIVSTDQTGVGNIRAIQTGGGVPNASFLNYTPGFNTANAGVVRVAGATGASNLFIYSGNSASHVVVDIMGFFASPLFTQVDNNVQYTTTAIAASTAFDVFSPACPVSFRLTGGGFLSSAYSGVSWAGGRPVQGASSGLVTGTNLADRWLCQGTTGAGGQTIYCFANCARVPGR